ncbi:hypothetical protein [Cellulomonas marina]|uniref:Uncharacterized protein n=1 Tax=Cellulomonas marina TaxID=988821 RepID=A0A1I0ZDH9_9CELL|nr:hypothetical protein [Cellulomonas marina]GIG28997.1 hypothetical protein Cma02nite_15970 [Cellulomonas marina]SFB22478.1 hypothetical protein SAMN05421867_11076 [Cellulomonas marina]
MPDYLAHVTVPDVPDSDTRDGMRDALGALRDDAPPAFDVPRAVVFEVRGEATDLGSAVREARAHALEVLDELPHEVEVVPLG